MGSIEDYNYYLPREMIAQYIEPKDKHKLLVYDLKTKKINHEMFKDIGKYMKKGDVIVVNKTKVYKAKIPAKKDTGGKVTILLTKKINENEWECIIEGKTKLGDKIIFPGNEAVLIERKPEIYKFVLKFKKSFNHDEIEKIGETPLPPYIKKESPLQDYQTVFAEDVGSVAAPTAGFHFSEELVEKLKKKGVKFAYVCLHVGLGTFAEVKEKNYKNHDIHSEEFYLDKENADVINNAEGIFVVGTTTMRVLETLADENSKIKPGRGITKIYIYPGYNYKIKFKAFITNFHLPKTTLLLMVSALMGKEELFRTYKEAIGKNYRFYSFGDAMMIKT
ncbi:tRNA preQ1(34) S-adenosylmethionine ribosyltransferase-isomerase QueA [Candidatus Micrarchaeota archaeon]|nr:tRNA preQ1(34) S-adenosylmethionine ribosyltransferase-isomerase QueA [Candidatus Micrarchaeota archaeon]